MSILLCSCVFIYLLIAAYTVSLCFALPVVVPDVFGGSATRVPHHLLKLRLFGRLFLELLALHYSSVLDASDVRRVDIVCSHLHALLDDVCFVTASQKPKWHYVLAHSALMMKRFVPIDRVPLLLYFCFRAIFVRTIH